MQKNRYQINKPGTKKKLESLRKKAQEKVEELMQMSPEDQKKELERMSDKSKANMANKATQLKEKFIQKQEDIDLILKGLQKIEDEAPLPKPSTLSLHLGQPGVW